jgi:hypothetical protein
MTETAASGTPGWLPPRVAYGAMLEEHEEAREAKEAEAARARWREERTNQAVARYIAERRAGGEPVSPMTSAVIGVPDDQQECDSRARSALQLALGRFQSEYAEELAWEKDHPRPPAGPPEPLHVFIAEPRLPAPAARSATGLRIFNRARHFRDVLNARAALAAAQRAAEASKHDYGLVDGVVIHRDR